MEPYGFVLLGKGVTVRASGSVLWGLCLCCCFGVWWRKGGWVLGFRVVFFLSVFFRV